MKSDEDIQPRPQPHRAGGDYQRAIDIYKEAMLVDPGNPRLKEELAQRRGAALHDARDLRPGAEGDGPGGGAPPARPAQSDNVRAYPERRVVGWFYSTDAGGAAAAVWFHKQDGRLGRLSLRFRRPRGRASPPSRAPPTAPRDSRPSAPAQDLTFCRY